MKINELPTIKIEYTPSWKDGQRAESFALIDHITVEFQGYAVCIKPANAVNSRSTISVAPVGRWYSPLFTLKTPLGYALDAALGRKRMLVYTVFEKEKRSFTRREEVSKVVLDCLAHLLIFVDGGDLEQFKFLWWDVRQYARWALKNDTERAEFNRFAEEMVSRILVEKGAKS